MDKMVVFIVIHNSGTNASVCWLVAAPVCRYDCEFVWWWRTHRCIERSSSSLTHCRRCQSLTRCL